MSALSSNVTAESSYINAIDASGYAFSQDLD
jgi:hypothetical protein